MSLLADDVITEIVKYTDYDTYKRLFCLSSEYYKLLKKNELFNLYYSDPTEGGVLLALKRKQTNHQIAKYISLLKEAYTVAFGKYKGHKLFITNKPENTFKTYCICTTSEHEIDEKEIINCDHCEFVGPVPLDELKKTWTNYHIVYEIGLNDVPKNDHPIFWDCYALDNMGYYYSYKGGKEALLTLIPNEITEAIKREFNK